MRIRLRLLGTDVIDLTTGEDAADEVREGGTSFSADLSTATIPFGYAPLSPDDEPRFFGYMNGA